MHVLSSYKPHPYSEQTPFNTGSGKVHKTLFVTLASLGTVFNERTGKEYVKFCLPVGSWCFS